MSKHLDMMKISTKKLEEKGICRKRRAELWSVGLLRPDARNDHIWWTEKPPSKWPILYREWWLGLKRISPER